MATAPATKDQEPTQGRKFTTTTTTTTTTTRPAPEQGVKCPRCDSSNTKFCYYNNYSLTQPRHFCKTCRRYWTNGGALRNVPIGGGCRKNKRVVVKPSSSSSSSLSSSPRFSNEFSLRGLNVPPSVEFNLGALPFPASSRLNIPTTLNTGLFSNQFSSSPLSFGGDVNSVSVTNNALSGFQLDATPATVLSNSLMSLASNNNTQNNNNFWALQDRSQGSTLLLSDSFNSSAMQSMQQSLNVHSSLASSIESLSCVNQDLHLKMQQQRYATMMFGGDSYHHKGGGGGGGDENNGVSFSQTANRFENQKQLVGNPVMFQNLEISKPPGSSVTEDPSGATVTTTVAPPTEWFFGNSSFSSAGNGNDGANSNNNNINININDANNNWSDALAWGDFQQQQQQQYSALP
ncbi:hypothetical protein AAZX31_08G267500 [Glycine max]|uniref:Dof zinc finger protein n=2 Tax=Glycine subgen. Soja TaxID=1462606 RepID=I1KX56_SOYBN|nr:dof zinc finger protein DOF5.7 [Glycine max]XP_028246795.1 dof zinc finger protein DOF5.7-like [Glycine soja]KAG5001564.1 hypothetical protein JHK87_022636 [Glycine soja]KAG5026844.1 hypothetical protein JHK86_022758 [Glycine max]KAG5138000.1 hypothetical protein JHK82_022731 [Glycine max]KAH1053387.1 hypothetical protein GYH30_022602 [Glycine max]KHN24133.1 Dof zinc finger protein DOF5.7 [Glycine soja]|eukprot:XP_006586514.1 dof zinc finger protein DOF5.7 [Glycine max]